MSSVMCYSTTEGQKAVDGQAFAEFKHGTCASTDFDKNPWLLVDLGIDFFISAMHIVNRIDCCPERLKKLHIEIGSSKENLTKIMYHENEIGYNATFPFDTQPVGRYVKLWIEIEEYLTVCELEVYDNHGRNIAFGKSVTLSSVYCPATSFAHLAVDGIKTGLLEDGCASTSWFTDPWMLVDLGTEYNISSIYIVNRRDRDSKRLSNFSVYIGITQDGMSEVYHQNDAVENDVTLALGSISIGRYVKISLTGVTILTICEIEIFQVGSWTSWSEWSPCTNSCENGTASRSRECDGLVCEGEAVETIACNDQSCAANVNTCVEELRDCLDIQSTGVTESAVHHVTPVGSYTGLDVYCDMTTENGGWLLIQRRLDESEDFNKTWLEYVHGFGNLSASFWLGLPNIHMLTSQGHYELRIDLVDSAGEERYANYKVFGLSDARTNYQLIIDGYTGDAGDGLSKHNGRPFSTDTGSACVREHGSGWWFQDHEDCQQSNLNGRYLQNDTEGNKNSTAWAEGIVWKQWAGSSYVLKKTEMKIRRK